MTRNTNARIAGITFLLYIAAGVLGMVVDARATSGAGVAEKLASITQHPRGMGIVFVLGLVEASCAFVLAVTLYAITREQDSDLALLALTFRVGEGLVGAAIPTSLGLLWLANATGIGAPDAPAKLALGALLFHAGAWTTVTAACFFAAGSTLFSWLLLRGRMIPTTLGRLGVAASALLVVALPVQSAGFLGGPRSSIIWAPMAVFEVVLAVWLLVRGVAAPERRQPT